MKVAKCRICGRHVMLEVAEAEGWKLENFDEEKLYGYWAICNRCLSSRAPNRPMSLSENCRIEFKEEFGYEPNDSKLREYINRHYGHG